MRLGGVWLICWASLAALVWPLARASKSLTTVSLGSCDAADFAAGGRVLMEFARHDRMGFLGLTEVVSVRGVHNFFDFWLQMNHFTPAALIERRDLQPRPLPDHRGANTVILVAAVPVVFWMARAALGYGGLASAGVAAIYAFSPILWYAVYHAAMGQLLAAPGIALVTWAGVAGWRRTLGVRRCLAFAGILAVAYALVLGSYNFIVVFCLMPAVAYAACMAVWQRRWGHLGRWLLMMLLPLAAVGALFWARVAGVVDRFALFQTYDFGWRIPALTPEGWLGLVRDVKLDALPGTGRWVLAALAVGALLAALWLGARRAERAALVAVCLSVPIVIGYGLLRIGGSRICTHTSYDSYKLMAVFYAGLLPAICYWLRPNPRRMAVPILGLCCLVGAELLVARRFQTAMATPPLIVDRNMVEIGRIESMPGVGSLNMRIPDMWSRLWASQFLLRRAQYFPTHTYEGHINTPLRGAWDMRGGLVTVILPGADTVQLNAQYSLTRVDSPWHIRAVPRRGWNEPEHLPRSSARWRWTKGDAGLQLGPHARPLVVVVRLEARSLVDRELQLWRLPLLRRGPHRPGAGQAAFPPFLIPPGMPASAAVGQAAVQGAGGHAAAWHLLLSHRGRGEGRR